MAEDDYMSTSFIENAHTQIKETPKATAVPKRKVVERIKPFKEREEESLQKGLASALNEENKGFRMLKMMGYKEGTGM